MTEINEIMNIDILIEYVVSDFLESETAEGLARRKGAKPRGGEGWGGVERSIKEYVTCAVLSTHESSMTRMDSGTSARKKK